MLNLQNITDNATQFEGQCDLKMFKYIQVMWRYEGGHDGP
jgi:hypothetical protein